MTFVVFSHIFFLRCEINVLQLESPDQVLLFFIIFFLSSHLGGRGELYSSIHLGAHT